MASSSSMAFKTFSLENEILEIPPQDEIFRYDAEEDRRINDVEPWKKDPHHFKTCKISAVALIKMVIHARSGVPWEIMGLMQGKVLGDAIVIVDSFALPVQGTETRVNAAEAANEYMVNFKGASEKVQRKENLIGWYHSHPGYGCWLSGIDVSTQSTYQKHMDPWLAIVIDPNRTISAGKVDIGAFRCYPEGYTPPGAAASSYQSIPLEKIEDFGVHADQYYSVNVEIFTSKKDSELLGALWNKYWVNTLSTSPLISNREYAASQLADLAQKLTKAHTSISSTRPTIPKLARDDKEATDRKGKSVALGPPSDSQQSQSKSQSSQSQSKEKKKEDSQLLKSARDSVRLAAEAQHGLISQVLKDYLFSSRLGVNENEDAVMVESTEGTPAKPANGNVPVLENAILKAAGVEASMSGSVPLTRTSLGANATIPVAAGQEGETRDRMETGPVPMSTSTEVPPGGTDSPMAVA